MYREARSRLGDPVLAWADLMGDPKRRRRYRSARDKVGLVRTSWDEALEITDTRAWPTRAGLHRAVFEYVEGWSRYAGDPPRPRAPGGMIN
jgi:hypothetical protein